MTKVKFRGLLILISMLIVAFPTVVKGQTAESSFDSISNQTDEVFHNNSEHARNHTEQLFANNSEFIDYASDGRGGNILNRTDKVMQRNDTLRKIEKTTNCSIVVGIAFASGIITPLAIVLGISLVFCLLGFLVSCCQPSNGDIPDDSCLASLQRTRAEGVIGYIKFACFFGGTFGIALGGYIADTNFHCFSNRCSKVA